MSDPIRGLVTDFSYPDPLDPESTIDVVGGYIEIANIIGGPSYPGAQTVGYPYYYESLSSRQDNINNVLDVEDEFHTQIVVNYTHGVDPYDTFLAILQTRYPEGVVTTP